MTTEPNAYQFPPLSCLREAPAVTESCLDECQDNMTRLAEVLTDANIRFEEITYTRSPAVTRFEIVLAPQTKVRSVMKLEDELALTLNQYKLRMGTVPGTRSMFVEPANNRRSAVYLRELLECEEYANSRSGLLVGLGINTEGNPQFFDLSKMPHLLLAGTTGAGKSVCINTVLASILFKATPNDVRLILIDPKKVEFSLYRDLPHLLAPIISETKSAVAALRAAITEMERRYEVLQQNGLRDIRDYRKAAEANPALPPMPHMVIVIDELADLMLTARRELEDSICRLAQKARAAGIHLIIGTQRPSVNVISGLIKANIPSRIAFTVCSSVDSRTILDTPGAEKLLGKGDMLFAPIGSLAPTRVQGAYVSDAEIEAICNFIRATNGSADYGDEFARQMELCAMQCNPKTEATEAEEGSDSKYIEAIRVCLEAGRASTSLLQRKLGIGYSRAARIMDRMEEEGLVTPPDGSKPRSMLLSPEQFIERYGADGTERNT